MTKAADGLPGGLAQTPGFSMPLPFPGSFGEGEWRQVMTVCVARLHLVEESMQRAAIHPSLFIFILRG